MNTFRSTLRHTLALALLVTVAACADEPDVDPPESAPTDEMAPQDSAADMTHESIDLEAMNESGVTGEAMGMHSDDAVVMMLEIEGLPGEGEYAAHIHSGNCADGGPVATPLDPVVGLADGTGSSTTVLELTEVNQDEPHFVMVHGEGGTPVACGDMEGHGS